MMAERNVRPDVKTYGSLMEACVQAGRQELALQIFGNALREVGTHHPCDPSYVNSPK